jgi:hypothetical protein
MNFFFASSLGMYTAILNTLSFPSVFFISLYLKILLQVKNKILFKKNYWEKNFKKFGKIWLM